MNLQGFRAVDLRGNAVFCPHQSLKWNTCRRQAVQYMCAGNTAPVWPQWYMTSAWCTGRKAVRNRATWCSELMMDNIQQAFTGRAARIRPRKESVEQQVGLLQHGAVWSQVRSLQGSENTHKNMVKSERSAKSSNAKWTFYLCVYVYWLYLNLTFRRVEENRSVRGTTSSYRHCSSTCKTSCIETRRHSSKLCGRYCEPTLTFQTCFAFLRIVCRRMRKLWGSLVTSSSKHQRLIHRPAGQTGENTTTCSVLLSDTSVMKGGFYWTFTKI